jgi:hypothetical protein
MMYLNTNQIDRGRAQYLSTALHSKTISYLICLSFIFILRRSHLSRWNFKQMISKLKELHIWPMHYETIQWDKFSLTLIYLCTTHHLVCKTKSDWQWRSNYFKRAIWMLCFRDDSGKYRMIFLRNYTTVVVTMKFQHCRVFGKICADCVCDVEFTRSSSLLEFNHVDLFDCKSISFSRKAKH